MPKLRECLKERSPITKLTIFKNNIIAYTTQYAGIKLIDRIKCEQNQKIICNELNISVHSICFSPNQKLLAFANTNIIYIVSLEANKVIKTIKISSSNVKTLIFSSDSLYIIVATQNGRVLKYRYNNSSLLDRLHSLEGLSRGDEKYISSFAILDNKLVCGGSDGSLIMIDLALQIKKIVLIKDGKGINSLCFIDKNTIISGDIEGVVTVHSLDNLEDTKTISIPFAFIDNIVKTHNENIVLISSNKSDYICAVDIQKGVLLKSRYIECESDVNDMVISNDNILYVVFQNNMIGRVRLPLAFDLKNLIDKNLLIDAYKLVEEEPLLHGNAEYNLLEEKYKKVYNQILDALVNQNITLALKLKKIIEGISSKEIDIAKLFKSFEHYVELKKYYLEKHYALAYGVANKYEPLKYTPIYKKLEEIFLKAFINAKRQMEFNNLDNAKSLLNEYITVVSKRPIIKLILQKDKYFFQFLRAIEKKDFQKQEELLSQHKVFRLAPTYIQMEKSIDKAVSIVELFINEGNLLKAKELLLEFKVTSYMKEKLMMLSIKIQKMNQLQNFYEKNNFKQCYELVDANNFLNDTKLGKLLNNYWIKNMKEGENIALSGDIVGTIKQLDNLLEIDTRKNKLGSILRLSSFSRIKVFIAKKHYKKAQQYIYLHIDVFGFDKEVEILMRTFEVLSKHKLAITEGQYERISRDHWCKEDILHKYKEI